jgi:hypothetical protein
MNSLIEKPAYRTYGRKPLVAALLVAGIATCGTATAAALPRGAILEFNAGVVTCLTGGTPPNNCDGNGTNVTAGSWFGMDRDNNGNISAGEKTPITPTGPVPIGATTLATNSHTGSNNGSENTAHDIWEFFSNTGMHYIGNAFNPNPITVEQDDTTRQFLDFSGWTVTWNEVQTIPMNAGAWSAGTNFPSAGLGRLICSSTTFENIGGQTASNCNNGDYFVLDYYATVPVTPPTGFEGVKYHLHLQGQIRIPGALATGATSINPGTTAQAVSSTDGRINTANLTSQGITLDTEYYPVSLFYDFNVTTATSTANVVIPLSQKIPTITDPATVVGWRIVNPSTGVWRTFVEDGSNAIKSAAGNPDACPIPGHASYAAPPTAGHYCLQLTIQDNGPNDNNATSGTISDPGGLPGLVIPPTVDTRTSSNSGCSLTQKPVTLKDKGDWLAVFGFLAWLGMLFRRRARAD